MNKRTGIKVAAGLSLAIAGLAAAVSLVFGTGAHSKPLADKATVSATEKLKTSQSNVNSVVPKLPVQPAVAKAAGAVAPSVAGKVEPVRSSLSKDAKVIDERQVALAPAKKNGRPRFRKEWLIEDGGLKIHLDEIYEQGDKGEMTLVSSHEYAADRVMLKMDGEKDFEAFRQFLAESGYAVRNPLMKLAKNAKIVSVLSPTADLDTVTDLQKAVAAFDCKLTAETDDVMHVNRMPSDLRYPQLWGMEKIEAPRAWEKRTDATPVVVAVVDTGVNYLHQDLAENMWTNPTPGSFDGYSDDIHGINAWLGADQPNNGSPLDDNGHGSHCAGTIGAVGDNQKGVAGVAWTVRIMALKFLNENGSGLVSDSIVCFDYAREHGADVVSCSFGGGCYSACVDAAIAALKENNAVVVCAAGNDGSDNDAYPAYPASYPQDNIISVASTDINDERSWFSNYGEESVDIAAPGEGIVSTYCTSDTSYESLSGTSMATPHVAGAVAMIKAEFPDETYRQTIERLYAGATPVEGLAGLVSTGKRLNVAGALNPVAPIAPTVTASAGAYPEKVAVEWTEVANATHYRLWRALSETDEKTALTGWTTATSFDDTTAEEGVTYYYFVKAATDAAGTNPSDYSVPAAGYVRRAVRDAWDPGDDTPEGATLLVVPQDGTVAVHSNHTLNVRDPYDWFLVEMTAGRAYFFEAVGDSDTYVELYSADDPVNRLDYDDDGGSGLNFGLTFTPEESGAYYLRVRCYDTGVDGAYDLNYSCQGRWDQWDPVDDTPEGATELAVGDVEGVHEPHTLSVSDECDYFKFELQKGYTYTFYTTGDTGPCAGSDTYGELYADVAATAESLVDFDDDSGDGLNFLIAYTPEKTGFYYLRVRTYGEGGDAEYALHYSRMATDYNLVPTPYDYYSPVKHWQTNPFLTTDRSAVVASTLFTEDDDILMRWAFNEENKKGVGKAVTNLVEILNVDGVRLMWGHAVHDGDIAGNEFVDFLTEFPPLPNGGYMARITLNCDVWGNHTIEETDYSDNEMLIGFTVMDPAKRLTGITITGNSEVESKQSAEYRCTASYSDTTEEKVIPKWKIASGAAYASISPDGTLTANAVESEQKVVVSAAYQDLSAVKEITVTPKRREHVSPFDPTVFYPNAPMVIVRGVVYIDGRLAEEGDEVAAFGASANGSAESRGYAKIEKQGRFTMAVYVSRGKERISFKVCDVSAGDDGEVLPCMQAYVGVPGQFLGTPENPVRLDSCSWDPFGDPLVDTEDPAVLNAKVTIDGLPASSGDILAVYDGSTDRLVGKQIIIYGSDTEFSASAAQSPEAKCTVNLFLSRGRHNLSFKVWDRNEQRLLYSYTRCEIEPGQTVGTEAKPFLVEAVTILHQDFDVAAPGWHLISFNVLPDAPQNTQENVFNDATSGIFAVVGPKAETWIPAYGFGGLPSVDFGSGYWIYTSRTGVAWRVEGHWSTDVEYSLDVGWNLIGYPLPRAGRIGDVLKDLMDSGAVEQIVGEFASYPNGNLDTFQPGQAYWVKASRAVTYRFNWSGMMSDAAARASAVVDPNAYGPFGDGKGAVVSATGENPSAAPGSPALFENVPVTLFGKKANPGDCVAVYEDGTNLVATAKVEDEDGLVSFPVYAEQGKVLSVRVWPICSGIEKPVIYTADELLTVPAAGTVVKSAALTVTQGDGVDGFTVTFDLGEGWASFSGSTNQVVAFGENATAPVIVCKKGYAFSYWDASYVNVRAPKTVRAVYRQLGRDDHEGIGFDAKATVCKVQEGSNVVLVVNGGSQTVDSSVRLYVTYASATASDLDLKNGTVDNATPRGGIKFPLELEWKKGDTAAKKVVLPVKADKTVEKDEVLLFQLADATGVSLDYSSYLCTVTLVDSANTEKLEDPCFVAVANSAVGGKTTGSGVCADNKKVTLKAKANSGYVFAYWYDEYGFVTDLPTLVLDRTGKAKSSKTQYVMPVKAGQTYKEYYALFVTKEADAANIYASFNGNWYDDAAGDRQTTNIWAGVFVEWPIESEGLSATSIKVSGLPSGLKFTTKDVTSKVTTGSGANKVTTVVTNAHANTIYGAPKAASGANKSSNVKVTVTTAGKAKKEFYLDLTVRALPERVVGTFSGGETNGVLGQAKLTVASSGKISGKWETEGKTWTLSAANFASYDASNEAFAATLTAKSGKTVEYWPLLVGEDGVAETDAFEALWSNWKVSPWKEIGKSSLNKKTVSYKVPSCCSEGDEDVITVTTSTSGSAKAVGQFGSYKASASTTVCPLNEQSGLVFVYFPPKASKSFAGFARWFVVPFND